MKLTHTMKRTLEIIAADPEGLITWSAGTALVNGVHITHMTLNALERRGLVTVEPYHREGDPDWMTKERWRAV